MTSAPAAGYSRARDVLGPRAHDEAPIPLPPYLIALGGLGLSFLIGAALARGLPTGIALLLGAIYTPIALINLPLALSAWIALAFISKLPIVSIAPTAASLLVLLAWLGAAAARRELPSPWIGRARALPVMGGLLVAWLAMSALWAGDAGAVLSKVWEWAVAVLIMVIIATTIRTMGAVRLLITGFVAGAVLSVAIGLVANGLQGASSAFETATSTEGRLQGGSGDPNYLAAGVVPALVFTFALLQVTRDALGRLALVIAAIILSVGLAATQSRGGLIALALVIVASLVVMRGRRAPLLAMLLIAFGFGAAWFAANPAALERITSTDNGGNGRSELWTVAGRMFNDRPLTGVGLNNFREEARDYTRDVGTLRFVNLIAERPHVVHNSYLQLLAETGVPGLAMFLAILGLVTGALRSASRRFRARGDRDGVVISDAVFVAVLSSATTAFFLSNAPDAQIWVLLGLAPALALMSTRPDTGGRLARPT